MINILTRMLPVLHLVPTTRGFPGMTNTGNRISLGGGEDGNGLPELVKLSQTAFASQYGRALCVRPCVRASVRPWR